MLTVQYLDCTLLSINIVTNDSHTCKVIKKIAGTYAYLICHVYFYSVISQRNHFISMYRVSL